MTPLNAVLMQMTTPEFAAFSEHLQEVSLRANQAIYEAGDRVEHIYFPSSAVLSVVTVMADGDAVESATIGREGGTGMIAALAAEPHKSRVFVQVAGSALRMTTPRFLGFAHGSPALLRLFMTAIHSDLIQAQQSVACNALHEVSARLPRWLLMTQDRVGGEDLPLTQEYLSLMLGVQRTTVSVAAAELKSEGLISYSRGHIRVLDRPRLLARSCECYSDVQRPPDLRCQ